MLDIAVGNTLKVLHLVFCSYFFIIFNVVLMALCLFIADSEYYANKLDQVN